MSKRLGRLVCQGRWGEAEELARAALWRPAPADRSQQQPWSRRRRRCGRLRAAACWDVLGRAHYGRSEFLPAARLLRVAFEARRACLGARHRDTLLTGRCLTRALVRLTMTPSMKAAVEAVSSVMHGALGATLGPSHPATAHYGFLAGCMMLCRGAWPGALDLIGGAYAVHSRALGPSHEHTLIAAGKLFYLLHKLGRLPEAARVLRDLHAGQHARLGRAHESSALAPAWDGPSWHSARWHGLGRLLRQLGVGPEAAVTVFQGLHNALSATCPGTLQAGSSAHELASALSEVGRWAEAEPLLREALRAKGRALGVGAADTAQASHDLGVALARQGRHEESLKPLRFAHAARKRLDAAAAVTADSAHELGASLSALSRWGEALCPLREAVGVRSRCGGGAGASAAGLASSRHALGLALAGLREFADAVDALRSARTMRLELFGEESLCSAESAHHLWHALSCSGMDRGEGEGLLRSACSVRRRLLGAHAPETVDSLFALGRVLSLSGKAEAAPLLREVYDHVTAAAAAGGRQPGARVVGGCTEVSELPSVAFYLGHVLMDLGRWAEAEEPLRALHADRRRVLGEGDPATSTSGHLLGHVMMRLSRWEEAHELLQAAHRVRSACLGPHHEDTLDSERKLRAVQARRRHAAASAAAAATAASGPGGPENGYDDLDLDRLAAELADAPPPPQAQTRAKRKTRRRRKLPPAAAAAAPRRAGGSEGRGEEEEEEPPQEEAAVDDPECIVCMEEELPRVHLIPCRHLNMCAGCAAAWVRLSPTCPTCRLPVTGWQAL